jgi:hypothetical protein
MMIDSQVTYFQLVTQNPDRTTASVPRQYLPGTGEFSYAVLIPAYHLSKDEILEWR